MLARIVKKVSGIPLKDFAQKNVFGPLGMKNSHFHDDVGHIIKNRAHSYHPSEDGFRNLIMRFDLVGSGGLYSTIEDMFLWDQNFNHNKLGKGSPKLMERMHEEGLLNSGKSSNYAFGLVNGTFRGLRTVGHGGALAGYRTFYLRFPEQQCSIIVLANVSNFRSGPIARAVASVVLEDVLEPQEEPAAKGVEESVDPSAKKTVSDHDPRLSKADLEQYAGSYFSDELNVHYQVFVDEGVLKSRIRYRHNEPLSLVPSGRDRFKVEMATFQFIRDDGKIVGLQLDAGRVKNLAFVRDR